MPTPHTNTKRCYPAKWVPEGETNPITDWFHKYVVTEVREADTTGGGPEVITRYSYLDGAAWHYTDDDGLIKPAYKTWSQWRGYSRVGVTVGEDPGEQTYTETRYFRGMHGDKLPSGTRSVTLAATGSAPSVNDEDWWAGLPRQHAVHNGPGGAVVSRTITAPWASPPTATRTIGGTVVTARHTGVATTWTHTARDSGRADQVNKISNSFDSLGMVVAVNDLGEDGVPGDETCTTTTYEPRNTNVWLMNAAHRVRSFAVDCTGAATPSALTDDDIIGDDRFSFDDHAYGAAPTTGKVTKAEKMTSFNGDNPSYVPINTTSYDDHGRVVQTRDVFNNTTTTAYTPTIGGPVTVTTVTNALGHTVTTTLDPAWGLATTVIDANLKQTDLRYDALGRLTGVWLADRDVTSDTASLAFAYQLRNNAPSWVRSQRLNPEGNHITSYTLYDALLRQRQTQAPSPAGGRILTNTFYDKLGRTVLTYAGYYSTGSPDTNLVGPADPHDVPTQTRTVYDGASRVTAEIFQPHNVERWRTSTGYGGDRTDVTPPDGGTATSTITDARGRTISLRQYHNAANVGSANPAHFDATSYAFNRKGQLESVTDPAGNTWTYTYDLRGRKISESDPDRGTTTFGYDNADRLTSTVDGRMVKLVYTYDALHRRKTSTGASRSATRWSPTATTKRPRGTRTGPCVSPADSPMPR